MCVIPAVFLTSCLLLFHGCYLAQAVPRFKSYCCCYVPSIYIIGDFYALLDVLEDNVPIQESILELELERFRIVGPVEGPVTCGNLRP